MNPLNVNCQLISVLSECFWFRVFFLLKRVNQNSHSWNHSTFLRAQIPYLSQLELGMYLMKQVLKEIQGSGKLTSYAG